MRSSRATAHGSAHLRGVAGNTLRSGRTAMVAPVSLADGLAQSPYSRDKMFHWSTLAADGRKSSYADLRPAGCSFVALPTAFRAGYKN
jgi:hypothetical protein